MSITMMKGNVLVQRAPREEQVNGVLLPNLPHDDKTTNGIVVAVGTGVFDVSVGDTVLFSKYANKQVVINEKKYIVLTEAEIYGVLL